MSIKSKALAAAAAVTLSLGIGAATAGSPAHAATPSCGPNCIDIFSKNFGDYPPSGTPKFALDVFRQSQKVGQPIILFRQANSDPAEDFTLSFEGQVSQFFDSGLVSAAFALHYGCEPGIRFVNGTGGGIFNCTVTDPATRTTITYPDLYAFEIEYAPFGVNSGLCVGATSAAPGSKVSLQACGAGPGTVWAADTLDSCPFTNPLYSFEVQAINGLDTNFSHPSVLTYPASGFPTDKPRPQLFLSELAGFSQTGGVAPPSTLACGGLAVTGPDNNQLWGAIRGILP